MKPVIFTCMITLIAINSDASARKVSSGNSHYTIASPGNKLLHHKSQQTNVTTSMEWIQELIDAHNQYRIRHNVPILRLDYSLCKLSQYWANHLARKKLFEHNYDVTGPYRIGENLARYSQYHMNRAVSGSEAAVLWYDEIEDYDFRTGKSRNENMTGHFTQLVWKETVWIGAAMAIRKDGPHNTVVIAANYYPTGNVNGQYKQNVPRPKIITRLNKKSSKSSSNEYEVYYMQKPKDKSSKTASVASRTCVNAQASVFLIFMLSKFIIFFPQNSLQN